jgi:muconolactone delta-isomerase
MTIIAIEREIPGVTEEQCAPLLRAEAERAWDLYRGGVIRQLYFRADSPRAVLILECANVEEANAALRTLPLVAHDLIRFEVLPLAPYPGFARLFHSEM